MRQTSLDAYRNVMSSDWISEKRKEIYGYIFDHGPMTCRELIKDHFDDAHMGGGITSRLSEMERIGALQVVCKRACKVTGNIAIVWDVTKGIPRQLPRKKIKAELKVEMISLINKCLLDGDNIPHLEAQILKSMIGEM